MSARERDVLKVMQGVLDGSRTLVEAGQLIKPSTVRSRPSKIDCGRMLGPWTLNGDSSMMATRQHNGAAELAQLLNSTPLGGVVRPQAVSAPDGAAAFSGRTERYRRFFPLHHLPFSVVLTSSSLSQEL